MLGGDGKRKMEGGLGGGSGVEMVRWQWEGKKNELDLSG